jgi:hypothetical protein
MLEGATNFRRTGFIDVTKVTVNGYVRGVKVRVVRECGA